MRAGLGDRGSRLLRAGRRDGLHHRPPAVRFVDVLLVYSGFVVKAHSSSSAGSSFAYTPRFVLFLLLLLNFHYQLLCPHSHHHHHRLALPPLPCTPLHSLYISSLPRCARILTVACRVLVSCASPDSHWLCIRLIDDIARASERPRDKARVSDFLEL